MYNDDPPQGPPPPPPQSGATWCRRLDCRSIRLHGRAAARGGLCRRHWARAGVGLQAVHRDDLLPLAHLDGEGFNPLGNNLVWTGKWGRQNESTRVPTRGGSGTCSSWPGRVSGDPTNSAAEDTPEFYLDAARSPMQQHPRQVRMPRRARPTCT